MTLHVAGRFSLTFIAAALCTFGLTTALAAPLSYYLPTDVDYDTAIPTPESFFGFEPGEQHVRHDQLAAYMHALADASDRITIEEYGRTYERRALLALTITSQSNRSQLDEIQTAHQDLADPARSGAIALENLPAVVYLAYGVHGNESSGSNAAPLIAYYLAAAQGPAVETLLKDLVIILDPCLNPDGLNRFAHWATMHMAKHPIASSSHREHREPWPSGRTNHYWFDLNRDWLLVQHPESQGRVDLFHRWKPNVLVDFHEMGTNSTYFFQPGVPSRNNPLTPQSTFDLTREIAAYHAQRLDSLGSLYYSAERFDDFYYGKGSTYPDVNGCIGILFEQASSRGYVQESIHGDLDFPFTIRNQVTTSFSTLYATQALRRNLLEHKRNFYASAVREAQRSPIKGYVFGSETDPARTYGMLEILTRHRIATYPLERATTVDGKRFTPGSAFIAPVDQPQFRLLSSLFEQRTSFEDSLFYDVSAWNLPLAFNVPFAELGSAPDIGRTERTPMEAALTTPPGTVYGGVSDYAYVFEWKGYYAPRAAYRLLQDGVILKTAQKPFIAATSEGLRRFGYGAILVPVGIQRDRAGDIDATLRRAAKEDGIEVYALNSGMTASGIYLGSPSFAALKKPELLLVVGRGVSAYGAGEIWHLLDQRFDIPVTLVESRRLNSLDLTPYTAIVLPDGSFNAITKDKGQPALERWIKNGGTLVAVQDAVSWVINRKFTDAKLRSKSDKNAQTPTRRPYASEENDRGAQYIGGAIVEARIDTTHPMCYGYSDPSISVFRRGRLFMDLAENPYDTPLAYADKPLQAGYISPQNIDLLRNSAGIITQSKGNGQIILFADNPNFRGFWYGTNTLFINALFFGNVID